MTLLDVRFRPDAVRALLCPGERRLPCWPYSSDSQRTRTYGTLTSTSSPPTSVGAFSRLDDVGEVKAGKLMARKRPQLIPMYDRAVKAAFPGTERDLWRLMRSSLEDADLRGRIEDMDPVS